MKNLKPSKQTLGYYLLLFPSLALLLVFIFFPALWAFLLSVFQYEIGTSAKWAGLDNYKEFFLADPTTWKSIGNMLFLTFFAVATRLTFPLVLARLIFAVRAERMRYFYRFCFILTMIVPGVVVQMVWGGMIYSENGLLNEILGFLHLNFLRQAWLNHPATVLWAIACIGFPFVGAFDLLIYYAGLSNISPSLIEAAKIDGAGPVRTFFQVELPLLSRQLKLIGVLSIIGGVQGFENLYILTKGGPGYESMVPGLWMYFNAFSFQRMGYASAVGVVLAVVIVVLTVLNLLISRKVEQ